MQNFTQACDIIDWQTPNVLRKAQALANNNADEESIISACFEFVRDDIKHSWDYQLNPVTLRASDVLTHGTGYCYAKSHLLAALLRANGIPTALCYQRLSIDGDKPPFCLHGLNAVYLPEHGWYRLDARGNKPGVDAQFCPPNEQLAFPIVSVGEYDLPDLYVEPLAVVVSALTEHSTIQAVAENLPDEDISA